MIGEPAVRKEDLPAGVAVGERGLNRAKEIRHAYCSTSRANSARTLSTAGFTDGSGLYRSAR